MTLDRCNVCNAPNKTIYWHKSAESGDIWCWCCKCNRGYSAIEYSYLTNIPLDDILNGKQTFENEITENDLPDIEFPKSFIPLSDPRAKPGIDYLAKRGLKVAPNLYYDLTREGIAFPYHLKNKFAGAQIRIINPKEGQAKITTLTGTRTSHIFYNWNQDALHIGKKYIVITEGAFNALSLQQVFNFSYETDFKNPFKCIAASGSNVSEKHRSILRDLVKSGYKVIACPDSDEAGLKMLDKLMKNGCCTHYALVEETGKDWNDLLTSLGDRLSDYFLSRIKKN